MKTFLVGIISFLMLTPYASAKNKEVEKCGKQDTALIINGHYTDWNLPMKFDKSSGFQYGMTNDDQNLYLEIKMTNPALIRKAIALGFNVWIDPEGKGKNVLGINYPQTRMHDRMKSQRNMSEQQEQGPRKQLTPEEIKKRRAEMIEKFNLRYLTGQETGRLINFDKEGMNNSYFDSGDINAIVQMNDEGEIVYEAIIPLKEVFKNTSSYLSKEKPFSLIFETGTFEQKVTASSMDRGIPGGGNSRQMEGEDFGEGGGMGEGVNGRMGSMHGGWGGGGFQAMVEPVKFKLKRVVLFQMKN
ncbi:MAG: hypothetical protein IH595_02070 [Bacteroidales bacterium]|nr:hypothetical protein [Bacteroidales bacterium]